MSNETNKSKINKRFFKDVYGELKKVVWPSKKQVVNNTGIVLAFMAVLAVVTSIFDFGLGALLKLIFGSSF